MPTSAPWFILKHTVYLQLKFNARTALPGPKHYFGSKCKRQRDKHKLTQSTECHSKSKSKMGTNQVRRFHRGFFAQSNTTAGLQVSKLSPAKHKWTFNYISVLDETVPLNLLSSLETRVVQNDWLCWFCSVALCGAKESKLSVTAARIHYALSLPVHQNVVFCS